MEAMDSSFSVIRVVAGVVIVLVVALIISRLRGKQAQSERLKAPRRRTPRAPADEEQQSRDD